MSIHYAELEQDCKCFLTTAVPLNISVDGEGLLETLLGRDADDPINIRMK